ncbi:MAG: hypothetical protein Kow0037_01560 [Calditrichia bacterium]
MKALQKKWLLVPAFLLLFLVNLLAGENLIFVPLEEPASSTEILQKYRNTIFLENKFALALVDAMEIIPDGAQLLENWQETENYFLLYPVREYDRDALLKQGNILFETSQVLVFRSKISELNALDVFHPFQIVKLNDTAIRQLIILYR